MRIPDPIANTTTEAYLAYKAGVLSEGDLKPKLYDPYIHLDAWLAYWAGLTLDYPVKNVGKNLFNKNSVSTGYLNADGTLSSDVAYKTSDFIAVKPNTAYSKTYTASPRTKYYNSTRQPLNTTTYQDISIGGAAGTFTTPANAAYVRFSFPVAGINLDTTQLELGSAVTAYEPYSGEPEMLTDEEALIAYLSGVTNTYPEEFRDPADVRVAAYLKYLVSARWGRPEYPVTNEELYLSMMDAPYIPAGEPSSDIEIDDTAEAPFKDVKMYGDTSQTTYTGKNKLNYYANYQVGYSTTINGVTYTMLPDGGIRMQGKNNTSSNSSFTVIGSGWDGTTVRVPLDGSTTYMSSISRPSNTYRWYVRGIGSGGSVVTLNSNNDTVIFSGCSGITYVMLQVVPNAEVNGVVYPMVEIGNQATSFEPYVGGTASPNPDYPQAVRTVTGENVVKICGKNLNEWENVAWSSSTTTSSWCFQNGATGAYGANITSLTKYKITLPAGTYTAKVYDLSSNIINIQVCADGTPNEIVVTSPSSINSSNLSSTITLAEATTVVVRYRTTNPSLGIGNTKLQIEKGSATAYEPYQGQSYEVNLGKNLFDKDNASEVINAFIDTSSHKISTGNSFRLAYIGCEPNTTYTISKTLSARFIIATTSETPANNVSVSQDVAKNTDTTYTITTNSTAKYLCVFLYHASYDTLTPEQILATLQIEKGSTATSYSAYFTPIELCKIGDYQDYIYKDGTDWKIHNAIGKITLDGSLDESIVSGGTATSGKVRFNVTVSGVANIGGSEVASYSNNFVGITRNDTWDCVQGVALGQNLVQIYCEATSGYNLDQFRTWLGSHNTTVYYPLATPTDTAITNSALIDQLNALKNGGSYTGTTYIRLSATDPNLPGLLKVEAYKYD